MRLRNEGPLTAIAHGMPYSVGLGVVPPAGSCRSLPPPMWGRFVENASSSCRPTRHPNRRHAHRSGADGVHVQHRQPGIRKIFCSLK